MLISLEIIPQDFDFFLRAISLAFQRLFNIVKLTLQFANDMNDRRQVPCFKIGFYLGEFFFKEGVLVFFFSYLFLV